MCLDIFYLFFFVPQVARLVEMGFSRIDALEALRASNNDINMATNFLLQHWEREREWECSVRKTEVKEDRERKQEEEQPNQRSQKRNGKKKKKMVDDGDKRYLYR